MVVVRRHIPFIPFVRSFVFSIRGDNTLLSMVDPITWTRSSVMGYAGPLFCNMGEDFGSGGGSGMWVVPDRRYIMPRFIPGDKPEVEAGLCENWDDMG